MKASIVALSSKTSYEGKDGCFIIDFLTYTAGETSKYVKVFPVPIANILPSRYKPTVFCLVLYY